MPWHHSLMKQAHSTRLGGEATETYRYRPLDTASQEIRVLHIEPKSRDRQVRCRLEHISLAVDPKPKYETISYCWGDPSPCRTIIVQGSYQLLVPQSAWLALKRLAYDDKERILWIDAVCINQQDIVERGHQVALMRDVYSHGTRNIVYLGEPVNEELMREAFATIKLIYVESQGDNVFQEMLKKVGSSSMGLAEAPVQTERIETSIHEFFSNPWFSRVWVLQETCLAAENLCVLGNFELDFRVVLEVAIWLMPYHLISISYELSGLTGLENAIHTLHIHAWYRCNDGLSLSQAFDTGQALEASNPRDKVYGLLGLVSKSLREVETIRPDYGKSWQDVYADFTREALRNSQGAILRKVSHQDEGDLLVDGLPSWVPRLQRKWHTSVDPSDLTYFGDLPKVSVRVDGLSQVLKLEGWIICTIKSVSDVAATTTYEDDVRWLGRVAAMAHSVAKGSHDDLARTLIADCNGQRLRSTAEERLGYLTLVEYHADGRAVPDVADLSGIVEPPVEVTRLAQYWEAFWQATTNRKFAISEQGHFLLVPKVTQPSDIVVYIGGCLVPLVLRQKGDHFLLLGQCYIDALMRWQEGFDEFYEKLEQTPEITFEIH